MGVIRRASCLTVLFIAGVAGGCASSQSNFSDTASAGASTGTPARRVVSPAYESLQSIDAPTPLAMGDSVGAAVFTTRKSLAARGRLPGDPTYATGETPKSARD